MAFALMNAFRWIKLTPACTLASYQMGSRIARSCFASTALIPKTPSPLRIALVCGGPSDERGISLNSARAVLDHLSSDQVEISAFYVDREGCGHSIPSSQLYSNTPSDFDFRLRQTSRSGALAGAVSFESLQHMALAVKESCDIAFPAMHGKFGEDGGVQALLEAFKIPFVGTGSAEAARAFDKFKAAQALSRAGFATLPSLLVTGTEHISGDDRSNVQKWFSSQGLDHTTGRVVTKPARAGSSMGVSVAIGVDECCTQLDNLLRTGVDDRVVVERFADGGREFTVIAVEGRGGPVALIPTEVELASLGNAMEDENARQIFSYRRKYLPTQQVRYHTPPRFPVEITAAIRHGVAKLFNELGLRDFARVDGWYMPPDGPGQTGQVVFSDINIVSGMEQTSFLFQQAAQVGLSHAAILRHVVASACTRHKQNIPWASPERNSSQVLEGILPQCVRVIFGGGTSERQVSLMSGTNVWLKLRECPELKVEPYLLEPYTEQQLLDDGIASLAVWKLPYAEVLRHTVEEVVDGCTRQLDPDVAEATCEIRKEVMEALAMEGNSELSASSQLMNSIWGYPEEWMTIEEPQRMSLGSFARACAASGDVVFIAVHGGVGENGQLQALLEQQGVQFTGCCSKASQLCMDKVDTGAALKDMEHAGIFSTDKCKVLTSELVAADGNDSKAQDKLGQMWNRIVGACHASCSSQDGLEAAVCIKPVSDGCSTGVARLMCKADLQVYIRALASSASHLLPGSLQTAHPIIEMPSPVPTAMLFEPFIDSANICVVSGEDGREMLQWHGASRWLEVTVGVIGQKSKMQALSPSVTIRESGSVLSLEEKFQGGTGINLTPPPIELISQHVLDAVKSRIALVANRLGIEGFSRIDAFVHADTGEIIIIEANTVPGMTPSTVLFHQALAETPAIKPSSFLKTIISLAKKKRRLHDSAAKNMAVDGYQ